MPQVPHCLSPAETDRRFSPEAGTWIFLGVKRFPPKRAIVVPRPMLYIEYGKVGSPAPPD